MLLQCHVFLFTCGYIGCWISNRIACLLLVDISINFVCYRIENYLYAKGTCYKNVKLWITDSLFSILLNSESVIMNQTHYYVNFAHG